MWTPPRARRGFQASLGVQYALGGGEILRDLDQQDVHPLAVELEAHLGFKVSRRWFVGAYVGGGPGVPGEDTRDLCEDADVDCHTESGRVGLMLKLDLKPDDAGNVWIALGGGVERHRVDVAVVVPGSGDPTAPLVVQRAELELDGVEPFRLMAGIDFRSTRVFGVGVYAALSLGRYRDVRFEDGAASSLGPAGVNLAEGNRATHSWFTVGVRGILFP